MKCKKSQCIAEKNKKNIEHYKKIRLQKPQRDILQIQKNTSEKVKKQNTKPRSRMKKRKKTRF